MAKVEDCPGFETFGADVKAAREARRLARKTLAEMVGIEWRYLANRLNNKSVPFCSGAGDGCVAGRLFHQLLDARFDRPLAVARPHRRYLPVGRDQHVAGDTDDPVGCPEIGRASCRERV